MLTPATCLLPAACLLLAACILLAGCEDDPAAAPPPDARGAPVILQPRSVDMLCDDEPVEFVVTGIDPARDAAFVYLYNELLYRVPFDGADTLRFRPDVAQSWRIEIVAGVEYTDGTLRLTDTLQVDRTARSSFELRPGGAALEYRITGFNENLLGIPERLSTGSVQYVMEKGAGMLGGTDDWYLLRRDYDLTGLNDTLRLRADAGRALYMYDFLEFLRRDIAPDTAGAVLTAEWVRRRPLQWTEIARIADDAYCHVPHGAYAEVIPKGGNVLRLTRAGGWTMDLDCRVEAYFHRARRTADSTWYDDYSLRVLLWHANGFINAHYNFNLPHGGGLPLLADRWIELTHRPDSTMVVSRRREG